MGVDGLLDGLEVVEFGEWMGTEVVRVVALEEEESDVRLCVCWYCMI